MYNFNCRLFTGRVRLVASQIIQMKSAQAVAAPDTHTVHRAAAAGQAVNLANCCKYAAVAVRMQHYMCKHTVWGDDMCYFACKFFSDSPPSEPTESDSGAGLKTEVCFYD